MAYYKKKYTSVLLDFLKNIYQGLQIAYIWCLKFV